MKTSLVNELVANFKKTLKPSSKWFAQDVEDFKSNVEKLSVDELQIRWGNMNAMRNENSSFNKAIRAEEKKMLKSGMFNVGCMKPENCLD